ncbi:hypothetical protein FS800_23215 [Agrobacterium vitis]|uniref:hypothetical protein n=1 Tax=Rhizobium/Agrobacterium group TaxID=227290 RepID=UPI0012E7C78F|nr:MULTISPECIES: hypothetical protein [Rhizobium/Agrobacterium group]MCF1485042.1 hypothetical protein [Allorhizobium ampelinum]MCF1492458.1 hypothetical protein [Allorhizobium ampelinum]MVA44448.1 hypothetical protein [Agrobacterium vitis]
MKFNFISVCLGVAVLSGCQAQINVLEAGGHLRVEKSNKSGSDYAVYLKNMVDFNLDTDIKATRDKIALDYLRRQCPAGTVVSEDEIATGAYFTGRVAKTYIIYVRCK